MAAGVGKAGVICESAGLETQIVADSRNGIKKSANGAGHFHVMNRFAYPAVLYPVPFADYERKPVILNIQLDVPDG